MLGLNSVIFNHLKYIILMPTFFMLDLMLQVFVSRDYNHVRSVFFLRRLQLSWRLTFMRIHRLITIFACKLAITFLLKENIIIIDLGILDCRLVLLRLSQAITILNLFELLDEANPLGGWAILKWDRVLFLQS